MLQPFFRSAMLAPGRQLAFRRLVTAHVLITAGLCYAAAQAETGNTITTVGYLFLVLGIVEGAALVGWRLTQMPKSLELEFLLTSPIQPRRVFLAEALVGISRFALVWLSGLPLFGGLLFCGRFEAMDLVPFFVMPFVWGLFSGLGLTAWIYEPRSVRRVGEMLALFGVVVYLIVGVVAGENLRIWLEHLPEWLGRLFYDGVIMIHTMNPFGIVRYWFAPDRVDWLAWERFEIVHGLALGLILFSGARAAFRLKGHFHDRHYRPLDSRRVTQTEMIGDRPLSWWAVRRVMEYSGRVNLWLAGGFSLIYSAYIIAGDQWPAWMGQLVFQMFEKWGGAPVVATALAVLAAVPAVFQFGLWDPTVQDRCRRLELLLLTELDARDYWNASLSASWKRGRGYLIASSLLWLALGFSGRHEWIVVFAALLGALALWAFSFAVGFRAFSTGASGNGIATLLTLGFPLVLFGSLQLQWYEFAQLIPSGLCYMPFQNGVTLTWLAGLTLTITSTAGLAYYGLKNCEFDLRRWYDKHQGQKAA